MDEDPQPGLSRRHARVHSTRLLDPSTQDRRFAADPDVGSAAQRDFDPALASKGQLLVVERVSPHNS